MSENSFCIALISRVAIAMLNFSGFDELERKLAAIDEQIARKTKRDAVTAAAEVLAARAKLKSPRPGYEGDVPGKPPLKDTIAVSVRDYGDERTLAVIGPSWPDGAHGHNVEFGHEEVVFGKRTGRRVPSKPFLRPAVDETQAAQQAAMAGVFQQALREVGG